MIIIVEKDYSICPFLQQHEEQTSPSPHQWLMQREDARILYLAIRKLKLPIAM